VANDRVIEIAGTFAWGDPLPRVKLEGHSPGSSRVGAAASAQVHPPCYPRRK